MNVSVASRAAAFQAIVREVEIEIKDLKEEHSLYKIQFADDASFALAFEFQTGDGSAAAQPDRNDDGAGGFDVSAGLDRR